MTGGVRLGVALLIGWAGAFLWAYGIAVLQPLCEPGSPFWESAENNSYWARDVRWAAIFAVSAVLAAAARRSWLVALAVPWLIADLALDRLDPGRPALLPAALVAGAVITSLAVATALRARPRPIALWIPLACLFLTGLTIWLQSPSDAEDQLLLSRLAAYAICAAATIVTILSSLTVSILYRRWLTVAGLAFAIALFGAFPSMVTVALLALCAAAVVLLREPWPGPRKAAVLFLANTAGLVVVGFVLLFALLEAGRPFTALAGNEPVNAADSDPSMLIWAVAVAAAWAGVVGLVHKVTTTAAKDPVSV